MGSLVNSITSKPDDLIRPVTIIRLQVLTAQNRTVGGYKAFHPQGQLPTASSACPLWETFKRSEKHVTKPRQRDSSPIFINGVLDACARIVTANAHFPQSRLASSFWL